MHCGTSVKVRESTKPKLRRNHDSGEKAVGLCFVLPPTASGLELRSHILRREGTEPRT